MKHIKKDEVYVINQPKHAIMSLVFVDPESKRQYNSNFMQENHNRILELAENTDVMFIFKSMGGIDPDVFSKVYGASAWIVSDKNLARTYIKAITYSIVIFKKLVGFLTVDNSDELSRLSIAQLSKIAGSGINWPIFEATHLDSEEMFEIYKKEGSSKPWLFSKDDKPEREYTTWKMISRSAFFRPSLFEKLDTLSDEYVDSFTWNHIKYFLASACEYLGIKRINQDLFSLDVNRLSYYADSEGKE